MKVYVAGLLGEAERINQAQHAIVAAGHSLTHDWTTDLSFAEDYASRPDDSATIARDDLGGVMEADAVVVLAPRDEPGRGLFVELGAALARAEIGDLDHVVGVGMIAHESVFYFHPRVTRVNTVDEWLGGL